MTPTKDEQADEMDWLEEELEEPTEEDDGYQIGEYDIIASPNDFNIGTIFNFINSGVVKIPGFQRNFVWDVKRASKLIESIIIGLPIPQIFLYEQSRNHFLVIDGQQRLMSIYYFINQRFPRRERSAEWIAYAAFSTRMDRSLMKCFMMTPTLRVSI